MNSKEKEKENAALQT